MIHRHLLRFAVKEKKIKFSSVFISLFFNFLSLIYEKNTDHPYLSFSRRHHAYMPSQMRANPASFKLLLLKLSCIRVLLSDLRASAIFLQLNTVSPQWYTLPKTCEEMLRSHSLYAAKQNGIHQYMTADQVILTPAFLAWIYQTSVRVHWLPCLQPY